MPFRPPSIRARAGVGLAVALWALAGCTDLPKDPEGTLERVRATGVLRVGVIADPSPSPPAGRFLARIAAVTGARPTAMNGSTERLLTELEDGRLDLVIGEMRADSPWSTDVTFILHPDQDPKAASVVPAAAARNGENGWIMLLEREAGLLGGGA